jgi:DNA recombination protein RmuC
MEILYLSLAGIIGLLIGWLLTKNSVSSKISSLESQKISAEAKSADLELGKMQLQNESANANEKLFALNKELGISQSNHENLQKKLAEQKLEVEQLQERFKTEFENIANKLLDEKSKKFTEQNKENMDRILNPLKENIEKFEKKVNETHETRIKENASLKTQIENLTKLNENISKEANNLTTALKGQTKTQGNWGEMILESILEKSGLVKDREYFVQESFTDEEGRRFQPDVLIKLPENKIIVIDAKVSLKVYDNFCSVEDETLKKKYLNEHLQSIRNHIKNLSEKKYQNLYQLQTLDFVLLFVPIEPAFNIAVQMDPQLYNFAFEKNIIVISTSTLFATLSTIASIWRNENQNKNAIEIARQSGLLYDKFVGLSNDLIELGNKMRQAQNHYESSMNKLTTGAGNLVKSVEKIKQLGAKTAKQLPQNLLDRADED